ncbi:hypothetical protein, unlikely [Trypanosoma congolense IL3000]|uniref:Variant surface glycoprotein n=1 Tax=Trypanosoma congolense (strain IL3000) TaxID=1068625 RepID=F9WFW0_TRYCI|nr:hypothetical protein, unlikely [Trypanosoma congolense IL3000]
MLGAAVAASGESDFNSNGKSSSIRSTSSAGICVFYGTEKWDENIAWLKKFKKCPDILDTLQKKTASTKKHLKIYQGRAEKNYKNVRAASELENPEEPAQDLALSEETNTNNTTYSRSHSTVFFLPWIFLIKKC